MMSIHVGEVIAIRGVGVTIRIFDESSKDTLFYNGEIFKGISIKEYLVIQRGFRDIVCFVEGEYLDEKTFQAGTNHVTYIRKVEVKPIGFFSNGEFHDGIKYLPMIKDPVYLAPESFIEKIYNREGDPNFVIGKMLKEDLPISLPWFSLFASHIGIFGNTGSGKSNTLTKLYTTLLSQKIDDIRGRSEFVLIDFNGEYTQGQLAGSADKKVIELSTRDETGDCLSLSPEYFWDKETLSILFKATANTQTPFLNRLIDGKKRNAENPDSLLGYIKAMFFRTFVNVSQKRETVELLKGITDTIGAVDLGRKLRGVEWFNSSKFRYIASPTPVYFDGDESKYNTVFQPDVDSIVLNEIDAFEELTIRVNLQLISDLLYGFVQFEHIQPLLKRIEASMTELRKVISVEEDASDPMTVTIISLRKCNQEVKKVVPLLLAKHYYQNHKDNVENPPDKTMHLIIDEAHNILSQQSTREHESWKDYRLELFEEIIKEGRKFGMYLTLSSQRPADISPTIMSQLHNYFIHRLVNDKDLMLIDSTVSTLDQMSKNMIPNLAQGCCIVTGTSFEIPLILQVDQLEPEQQPDSDDVDLRQLWQ